MSFLSIPSQEGLFTTIKSGKSAEGAESRSPMAVEDNDDDDEDDDDTEDVHLIPRCSPVPRKRGASIFDETAEYMRIHLALTAGKRVSFADTTGGDLVDVKEFVAFDSDDEEDKARWEEEELKYRKPEQEPTYKVHPEFSVPTGSALLQAVHANKVEVEQVSPVEDEPLSFSGFIRVLNISFHKAVYLRSTMDNWASYFDYPAEYVQGSNDGDTDQFSFKLSFAPPYITHGSRIEFVIRYETSDGDFWANNSSMNYVVTLLLSYDDPDDPVQTDINTRQIRSILKPPKAYSVKDDSNSEDTEDTEKAEAAGTSTSGLVRPTPVCPVIVKPEIDVENAVHPSGSPVPPNQELPSVDGTQSAHPVSPGEPFPCMSSENTLQANSAFVLCASKSVQPNKSQPLPRLHCELGSQASEQTDRSPSALLPPSLQQGSEPRSDNSQADAEEIPSPEVMSLVATKVNLRSTTEEDGSTKEAAGRLCLEQPAESVCPAGVTRGFDSEVAVGLSEGLSEVSTSSAVHYEGSMSALFPPVVETHAPLRAEGESLPSPERTQNTLGSTDVTKVSQNFAAQSVSACEERKDKSPDTLLGNAPNTLSEVSEAQPEYDVHRSLMPSIIFLSGVVSLSIVLQQPDTLFLIGLLLVLHRL